MASTPRQLGHLVIKVRDLKRSERFYTEFMGLNVTGRIPDKMVFMSAHPDSSHELAIVGLGDDAPGPDERRVGLAHMAWQMDTMDDLREIHRKLKSDPTRTFKIGDHGMSLGLYFQDPDGNEIETFFELLRAQWPKGADVTGGAKFPLELEEEPAVADD